ncbi:MAG: hypothetical protein WCY36_06220 [Candidatus Omnitrophota bacterium]
MSTPPFPKRLGKKTKTKGIDGSPFVYTVIDEDIFLAKSNPNKAFCLHKIIHENGKEGFRIGYYMIAHKPRMKGKWAWGQFAPMMTKEEMLEIIDRLKAKKWF